MIIGAANAIHGALDRVYEDMDLARSYVRSAKHR
jgi:hypothetical protein